MKTHNRKLGFTMVEIMFTMVISLIVLELGMKFVIQSMDSFGVSVGNLDVNYNLRNFTQNVLKDCNRAQTISLVNSDEVLLIMRDGSTVRYTRNGGSLAGSVTRADSATGSTISVANQIEAITGSPFFTTTNNGSSLLVQGTVISQAKSIRSPRVLESFGFTATRRG
jgi:hypothetical protein